MLTKHELEMAIEECEQMPVNLSNCDKLAIFYTIYDHLYSEEKQSVVPRIQTIEEEKVGNHGDSDFLIKIEGMEAGKAWEAVDELVEALKVVNPRLYDSFMRKI